MSTRKESNDAPRHETHIVVSSIAFGEVDRKGSYFYYTTSLSDTARYKSAAEVTAASATAKCLWYHHAPPSGMFLIVR
jgi:hypothetical protein